MSGRSSSIRLILESLGSLFGGIDRERFERIVEVFEREKTFSEDFFFMLRNLIRADDTPVTRAMIPRVEMKYVRDDTPLAEVMEMFRRYYHTKYPVMEKETGDFIGILYIKDVFLRILKSMESGTLSDIMGTTARKLAKPAQFIPFNFTILEAIEVLKEERMPIALVVDEFGVVVGMVTMEDLVEEIVGDIRQSYQESPQRYRVVMHEGEKVYRIDARMPVDEFISFLEKEMGIRFSPREVDDDISTLAGLILKETGGFPEVNSVVRLPGLEGVEIVIKDADKRRIKTVLIRRKVDNN